VDKSSEKSTATVCFSLDKGYHIPSSPPKASDSANTASANRQTRTPASWAPY